MKDRKSAYVLDTSAVMAFIRDEEGAARVEEILQTSMVILPILVLLEVYYVTWQRHGEDEADKRYGLLKSWPVVFVKELDEPTLLTAGRLKQEHRLSLADAIIAAIALRQGATLVHKDPEYKKIALLEQEVLPGIP